MIFFPLKALALYMEAKCSWKTQEVSLIVLKLLEFMSGVLSASTLIFLELNGR